MISADADRQGTMVSSSLEAIKRVIAAFERSDWTEIDVRSGDVRVHLAAGDPTSSPAITPIITAAAAARTGDDPADVAADVTAGRPSTTTPTVPGGAHVVVSPSPGIVWRSPEPGAPHFAAIGDVVEVSSTVCIVEVMKLMSHVKAGVAGEIVAVYVDNGVSVEKGAPLFAIAPSGSSA
jgi:acetyl-CoA carboxylase biotin carboxyl carrier protein